jgi:hypothetical protein
MLLKRVLVQRLAKTTRVIKGLNTLIVPKSRMGHRKSGNEGAQPEASNNAAVKILQVLSLANATGFQKPKRRVKFCWRRTSGRCDDRSGDDRCDVHPTLQQCGDGT